jgi:glucoamylase
MAVGLVLAVLTPLAGVEAGQVVDVHQQGVQRLERIQERRAHALDNLLSNLNQKGAASGAVVASPSRQSPNYFYHWVRDAALVMAALIDEVDDPTWDAITRRRIENHIRAWIAFETRLQVTPNRSGGLGEPRFMADGRADEGDWGRPQNDGAALRASSMIAFAWREIWAGRKQEVLRTMYRGELPASTPIKKDLEFVAHHWDEPSFDLWEEVKGDHFYTRSVQHRALVDGAALAEELGDNDAANFYREQANLIDQSLERFKDPQNGFMRATINQVDGWTHKTSGLDVSVLLGSLHGRVSKGSSVHKASELLEKDFLIRYPLNARATINASLSGPAPAIGRYPEDVYDGIGFDGGNPWFLATHAYAEWHCRTGGAAAGGKELGLRYLERSMRHQGYHASMSEQFRRTDGFMQGAPDLTWSYASFLTAARACLTAAQ